MRADVLRLLPAPVGRERKADRTASGQRRRPAASGLDPHTVTLPDSGIFNFVPQSAGASLLVIYQDPDQAAPLTSIVVYDGLHVQAPGDDTQLNIRGFVDAVNGSAAKLTYHRRERICESDRSGVRRVRRESTTEIRSRRVGCSPTARGRTRHSTFRPTPGRPRTTANTESR